MSDKDRLGALKMRVAGHYCIARLLGKIDQGLGPLFESGEDAVDGVADEETHVGRDLLVAGAAGVEFERERANVLGKLQLDKMMDVFSFIKFITVCTKDDHLTQPFVDYLQLFWRENSSGGNRACMSERSPDFFLNEALIEREGALPLLELFVEGLAEATGPHFSWIGMGHDFV